MTTGVVDIAASEDAPGVEVQGAPRRFIRAVLRNRKAAVGAMILLVMVFIAAFGAYVTPKLLGGSSGIMFGNVLADQYSGTFNWPFGAVLALIMIAVVLGLLVVASRFARLDAVFGARA